MNALLADDRTTFLLVTSPRDDAIDEAIFFHKPPAGGRPAVRRA